MTCLVHPGSSVARWMAAYPLTTVALSGMSATATSTPTGTIDGDTSAPSAGTATALSNGSRADSPTTVPSAAPVWSSKPCPKCQGRKPARKKLCDDCRTPDPTCACGSPVAYRSTLCLDCRETHREANRTRKKARDRLRQGRPCRGCGGPKPHGRRVVYCLDCQRRRGAEAVRQCERCPNPSRSKHAKLCADCHREAVAAERAYKRQWWHDNGRPPSKPKKASTIRMQNRLRAERQGRELVPVESIRRPYDNGAKVDHGSFPRLPAMSLHRAVTRLIEREASGSAFGCQVGPLFGEKGERLSPVSAPRGDGDGVPGVVEAIGLWLNPAAGAGALQRRMSEWLKQDREYREGFGVLIGPRLLSGAFLGSGADQPRVAFDLADTILTNSGLCWFDVWDGPELCSNGQTVEQVFTSTAITVDG